MPKWSARIPLAFPIEHLEAANALAYLIDPDTGGALTFSLDNQQSGYVVASIQFVTEYAALIGARDAAAWRAVVDQLATERNRPNIDDDTLELLRSTLLFGDECNETSFALEEALGS